MIKYIVLFVVVIAIVYGVVMWQDPDLAEDIITTVKTWEPWDEPLWSQETSVSETNVIETNTVSLQDDSLDETGSVTFSHSDNEGLGTFGQLEETLSSISDTIQDVQDVVEDTVNDAKREENVQTDSASSKTGGVQQDADVSVVSWQDEGENQSGHTTTKHEENDMKQAETETISAPSQGLSQADFDAINALSQNID